MEFDGFFKYGELLLSEDGELEFVFAARWTLSFDDKSELGYVSIGEGLDVDIMDSINALMK